MSLRATRVCPFRLADASAQLEEFKGDLLAARELLGKQHAQLKGDAASISELQQAMQTLQDEKVRVPLTITISSTCSAFARSACVAPPPPPHPTPSATRSLPVLTRVRAPTAQADKKEVEEKVAEVMQTLEQKVRARCSTPLILLRSPPDLAQPRDDPALPLHHTVSSMSTARSCDSAPSEPSAPRATHATRALRLSPRVRAPSAQADKTMVEALLKGFKEQQEAQQEHDEKLHGAVGELAQQQAAHRREIDELKASEEAEAKRRELEEKRRDRHAREEAERRAREEEERRQLEEIERECALLLDPAACTRPPLARICPPRSRLKLPGPRGVCSLAAKKDMARCAEVKTLQEQQQQHAHEIKDLSNRAFNVEQKLEEHTQQIEDQQLLQREMMELNKQSKANLEQIEKKQVFVDGFLQTWGGHLDRINLQSTKSVMDVKARRPACATLHTATL